MTVSGVTKISGDFQLGQIRDNQAQKIRSGFLSLGFFFTSQYFQLMPQGKILKDKISFIPEYEVYKAEDKFCY